MLARPERPSFTKDILPIFERMTNLQWVNAGFAAAFGWGGQFNYTTTKWVNNAVLLSKKTLTIIGTKANGKANIKSPYFEKTKLAKTETSITKYKKTNCLF